MNSVIYYYSKHGTTKKIVDYVEQKLQIVDIYNIDTMPENVKEFDDVLLFTPVYAGSIPRKVKVFINENRSALLDVNLSIFLCGANTKEEEKVIPLNFHETIIEHANFIKYIGGGFDFNKLNFLEKLAVRVIAKQKESTEKIDYDLLDSLLKKRLDQN
jgi:menaquinone-dependent protoporphyrinogen oxidase